MRWGFVLGAALDVPLPADVFDVATSPALGIARVCLGMLAKNEEDLLSRHLPLWAPLVDAFVVRQREALPSDHGHQTLSGTAVLLSYVPRPHGVLR